MDYSAINITDNFLTVVLLLSCSGGYFIAVKEVSLLDQGEQGRQSVFQLEQVNTFNMITSKFVFTGLWLMI